jgi:hypothetical protein
VLVGATSNNVHILSRPAHARAKTATRRAAAQVHAHETFAPPTLWTLEKCSFLTWGFTGISSMSVIGSYANYFGGDAARKRTFTFSSRCPAREEHHKFSPPVQGRGAHET